MPGVFEYGLFPETDIAACDKYHFIGERRDVGFRVERHRLGGPKHCDDTDPGVIIGRSSQREVPSRLYYKELGGVR